MAFVPFVETDQPTMAAFNEKFQQNYEAVLSACPKVAVGNYVGTGVFGESAPRNLSFEFSPKIIFIGLRDDGNFHTILIRNKTNSVSYYADGQGGHGYIFVSWSENGVSFYSASNANQQLNVSNKYYDYVAIG